MFQSLASINSILFNEARSLRHGLEASKRKPCRLNSNKGAKTRRQEPRSKAPTSHLSLSLSRALSLLCLGLVAGAALPSRAGALPHPSLGMAGLGLYRTVCSLLKACSLFGNCFRGTPRLGSKQQRVPVYCQLTETWLSGASLWTLPSTWTPHLCPAFLSLSLSLSTGRGVGSSVQAASPVRTRTPAVLGRWFLPPGRFALRGSAVRGVG